ncbi:hypothetical protein L484_021972 [Morus notabilis]|uniref:RNase H type-1 domain-containing protein n=1 Tax=Morus notabilis TaxID=981085 RepID=W9QXG1_9ROSA|nr:hypothetical protein L484_021972 [Morus notabilis]
MGIGDFIGFVIAALAKKLDGVFSVHEAEAEAIFMSLFWVLDVGLNLQFVESDALTIILGAKLCHAYSEANRAAHILAVLNIPINCNVILINCVTSICSKE